MGRRKKRTFTPQRPAEGPGLQALSDRQYVRERTTTCRNTVSTAQLVSPAFAAAWEVPRTRFGSPPSRFSNYFGWWAVGALLIRPNRRALGNHHFG